MGRDDQIVLIAQAATHIDWNVDNINVLRSTEPSTTSKWYKGVGYVSENILSHVFSIEWFETVNNILIRGSISTIILMYIKRKTIEWYTM